MAIIIEDGTIVGDANSFATVSDCRAYADGRGLELPEDDTEVENLLVKACDFLFSLESDFQGFRSDAEQELPFPRIGVEIFGNTISGDTIPKTLKKAQCQLAFDAIENDLLATGSGRVIKKEGVGPLATEYGDDGASNPQVVLTAALTILKPLFKFNSNATGGSINVPVGR